jgi:hypothetical protein
MTSALKKAVSFVETPADDRRSRGAAAINSGGDGNLDTGWKSSPAGSAWLIGADTRYRAPHESRHPDSAGLESDGGSASAFRQGPP